MAQISWENESPRGGEADGIDRISELLEDVAHHILSFLPTKDVFRTSCLSKLWKTTSSKLPILNFDQTFFHGVEVWDGKDEKLREKLVNFVEQTLQRRLSQGITIYKLELDIPSTVASSSEGSVLVDRWIGYAVKSNVKHLSLNITDIGDNPHSLPLTLFSANSVTTLELSGARMELPPTSKINLPLKKLHLSFISMGDECFQKLIGSSKDLLEDLSICLCSGLNRVKITGLVKLKKLFLVMYELESLEIEALMNLEELFFSGNQINIRACKNLKSLTLSETAITDSLLRSGFTLESTLVCDSWYSRQVEFLGKFNHCKIVELNSESSLDVVLIPKELREALVPPLYNVKHLSLKTIWEFNNHVDNVTVELVDCLLWICPHLETLTIKFRETKKSIKFLYEEVVDNEGNLCPCCKSLPIACWRHCLKKVVVQNTLSISNSERRFGDETKLKNFFLEKAEILERMDDLTDCKLKS